MNRAWESMKYQREQRNDYVIHIPDPEHVNCLCLV